MSVILITGSRKGIGRYLAEYYLERKHTVVGISRSESDLRSDNYTHFQVDIKDEHGVVEVFRTIRREHRCLDVLINNAGIASMNHSLLTPVSTVSSVLNTNVLGSFLCLREAAKIMKKSKAGRIVNFTSVAHPLKLEGEAIYAASKAAVVSLTQILAKELAELNITVNAIGPTPIRTDLIKNVPKKKLEALLEKQTIHRFGEFEDVSNVVDFFIDPKSDFITGQIIYLGGVS